MKNTKIANININLKKLFSIWLDITEPLHNLRTQEKRVLSLLLYHYYILQKEITNDSIVWKVLFDYDKKLEIRKELDIKNPSFNNVLTSLRKKNVIINDKISNIYIPNIEKNANNFKIVFNFNIIDNGKK
jgi:hypothetical protein